MATLTGGKSPEVQVPNRGERVAGQSVSEAFSGLLHEHQELRDLFSQFARTGTGCVRSRQILLDEMCQPLETLLLLEERFLVPVYASINDSLVLQCREDTKLIRALLRRIVRMELTDKSLEAKVKWLEKIVFLHVETLEKVRLRCLIDFQGFDSMKLLSQKIEMEQRRMRGLYERRLRFRDYRQWLAAREKNSRRFFGGYAFRGDGLPTRRV